jgi:hypothetical protein
MDLKELVTVAIWTVAAILFCNWKCHTEAEIVRLSAEVSALKKLGGLHVHDTQL